MPLVQYVEPGGENYLQFAKRKLQFWHAEMKRSGMRVLARTILVSDGSTIYVNSQMLANGQFDDRIRITAVRGFEFLVAYLAVDPDTGGDATELWALKRDSVTQLYVPVKVDTWIAGHNPWENSSDGAQPVIVTRDVDHGVSVWGNTPETMRRGAESSPADTRTIPPTMVFSLSSSAEPNLLAFIADALAGPAIVRRIGAHADIAFPLADFIVRAKAVFPIANSWSYSAGVLYPAAPDKLLAITRPTIAGPGGFALYAEKYRVVVDLHTDDATLVLDDILKTDEAFAFGGGTAVGERFFSNPHNGLEYTYAAATGQLEWSKFTLVDVSPSGTVRGPSISGPSEPDIPRPFNNLFMGDSLPVAGPPLVPGEISFMGQVIHDEVSSHGFPFFCNVWPVPVRIKDDHYWWINTQSIKSTEEIDTGGFATYVYCSPHEYRYRALVLKNGAVVKDQAESRNYVAYTDDPQQSLPLPADSWDSTAPVYIYFPSDGVRIGGVDWFCGVRIEQVFTTFSAIGVKDLQYKVRPAVWTADLSEVHTYADFEMAHVPAARDEGAFQDGNSWPPEDYYFARYKGAQFFVFVDQATDFPWGVGMGAPDSAPVNILSHISMSRSNPVVLRNPL